MYNTDKYQSGLIQEYEKLFANRGFSFKPVNYCEMGILDGGSIRWAKDYFFDKGTQIHGLDMDIHIGPIEGVELFSINQNDGAGLDIFGNDHGPFDIIIDDGSHVATLTLNTFQHLYPRLKQGGIYIIEDWDAGYFPQWQHCVGMEKLVTDLVWAHGGQVNRPKTGGSYAIIESV